MKLHVEQWNLTRKAQLGDWILASKMNCISINALIDTPPVAAGYPKCKALLYVKNVKMNI